MIRRKMQIITMSVFLLPGLLLYGQHAAQSSSQNPTTKSGANPDIS
jgi:hypothetical protein